jgi:hypothetical protein
MYSFLNDMGQERKKTMDGDPYGTGATQERWPDCVYTRRRSSPLSILAGEFLVVALEHEAVEKEEGNSEGKKRQDERGEAYSGTLRST